MNTKQLLTGMALAVASLAAHAAPATLSTGLVSMGVADNAGLGAGGLGFTGPTGDAIIPGCLCEGWGAAGNGSSGYVYGLSPSGITSSLLTTTTATGPSLFAQSVVLLTNGLQITHTYTSAAGGKLFDVSIDLKNTNAATMTDVRYARTLDWDVTPGYFSDNFTTVYGGTPTGIGGKVLNTSTNPFAVPDPLVFRTQDANVNVVDTPGDDGGYFVFGFGDLAAGASVDFDTYIGADTTVAGLLAALGSVGVEAYSYTTGDTSGVHAPAYGYGFKGLGLPPSLPGGPTTGVPEPESLALLAIGLVGLATIRRRRK